MVPRQKAGHMTACHPIVQNIKKSLANRGRPHMSRWRVLLVNSGSLPPTIEYEINVLRRRSRPKTTSKTAILRQCDNTLEIGLTSLL